MTKIKVIVSIYSNFDGKGVGVGWRLRKDTHTHIHSVE